MIDFINYYFDLYPANIENIDDRYIFEVNLEKYCFMPYNRDIEELNELIKINKQMIYNGSLVHEIIFNKFNSALNNYNNKYYILLRIYVNANKKVDIKDILCLLNETNIVLNKDEIYKSNWIKLWENKIDYFEYQMLHMIKKYPTIYSIMDYYIGLGENAISYMKSVVPNYNGNLLLGITHRRIGINSTLFDLYNPLELIIDFKVRDLGEYLKDAYFNNINVYNILEFILKEYYFDKLNLALLVSRLLFPTYFFDIFDNIVSEKIEEKEIISITKKSSGFEDFVCNVIKRCNLQTIGWIAH